jgi:hypothetical protein
MATFDQLYAQRFPGSVIQSDFGPSNAITFDNFMAMTPEERALYFQEATPATSPVPRDRLIASALRNIVPQANSIGTLSQDQYRQILSEMDPATAQAVAGNLGTILEEQQTARTNDGIMHDLGIFGPLLFAGGGALLSGAFGGGAAAAGGTSAAEGLAVLSGEGLSSLGAESFLGPATGTIESAPVIGGIGAPTVSGIATGAGPFVPTALIGSGAAAGISGALAPASGGGTAAGGAGAAAGGSALGNILRGNGTLDDYLNAGGAALPGIIGAYGAGQQADAIRAIADQARADRAPFLNAATGYLANPQSYADGPGRVFMDSTLRRLSATHGNPIDSGTAMGLATQAGLADWRNAVTGFGNMGLAGEDTRSNLGLAGVNADMGQYNALGGAFADVMNPRPRQVTLSDIYRGMRGLA